MPDPFPASGDNFTNTGSSEWTRQDRETPRAEFVERVKREGRVYASPSHQQTTPCKIEASAILQWQWDGELFAMTITGRRVVANATMPAFHVWDGIPADRSDKTREAYLATLKGTQ